MKLQSTVACLLSTLCVVAAKVPTVWLAGDSTTAPDGGKNGTQGWGQYLKYSLGDRALVNNSAFAGRSARSFTREGRFERIAQGLQPGDWVVIEFGINDAGAPKNGSTSTTGDKGRPSCPGEGNETCTVDFNNTTEIVQTFPTYVKAAAQKYLDLGAAGIVIAEQLPTNVWESGSYTYRSPVFAYYSELATIELGGPASNVFFVQHGAYAAQAQKLLGKAVVDTNYPMDHTHTAPFLADVHSQAFVLGLKCGTSPLANLIVNATARIEQERGPCLPANATLPI
ncbi:SGNH hydrolase-type esterase domain-containing protein [Boeremia exigua]|uniref:SGNH hydrolase-type esterase domain-containing protein n=1 Tax=Boeremia exigua TaxID=749465 RepID=UPI001E8EA097|nr:SGNH hydrolase-type esterase domain-containing protein [Boeremia exigua]KAH6644563.1 SGNH hydrolase-type esterase domain-containing protein [Boeremia exigua]